MGSRFEKFSERARRVLSLAQEEAQRFNHNYIGTEHILLGLVRETEGVAARVLSGLTIDLSKVRSAVEFIIGRGEKPAEGEAVEGAEGEGAVEGAEAGTEAAAKDGEQPKKDEKGKETSSDKKSAEKKPAEKKEDS